MRPREPGDPAPLAPEQLDPIVAERLGGGLRCVSVERAATGNAQETWFVRCERPGGGGGPGGAGGAALELVLRRSAVAGFLSFTDRRVERFALAALRGSGLAVPRLLWFEDEPSRLGRPYLVMERLPGVPGGTVPPGAARLALLAELGEALASLHALDPGALSPALPASAGAATDAELAAWRSRYRAERAAPEPAIGALLAWLVASRRLIEPSGPARLLWGDPGLHNVLIEGGRLSGLLDFELAHVGDPLEDLGAALWSCASADEEEALLAAYEGRRGARVDPAALSFYVVMACVTRSVMLSAGVAAYVAGRADQPSIAALGLELANRSLLRACALAGWTSGTPEPPGTPGTPGTPGGAVPGGLPLPAPLHVVAGAGSYLRTTVLPAVEAAYLRRGLKTLAALLDATALRLPAPSPAELAAAAELEERAEHLEAWQQAENGGRAPKRSEHEQQLAAVRGQLVERLLAQRAALQPLAELYGAPPLQRRQGDEPRGAP